MAQPRQAAATTPVPPALVLQGRRATRTTARPNPMLRRTVDGPALLRAVRAAVANLEAHVHEVDALNVFPVPDGDTGSNMLATMRAALAEAERLPPARRDLSSVAAALSRGALTGARGNSGVILSQIIRGMTHGADGRARADGLHLAHGLRRGSEVAYGAVLSPVEGTILTVIRDAAAAAETAAGRRPHVESVLTDVIAAAADSVQRTPQLLPVLEHAGVVDSGGQGLYRLFEGMIDLDGTDRAGAGTAVDLELDLEGHMLARPTSLAPAREAPTHATERAEHGYETEFLVAATTGPIDVDALRAAITAVGDSIVVAGDASLVRVHVHGDRPDQAIAAGLAWGRLSDVSIRDLDDQVAHNHTPLPVAAATPGHAPSSHAPSSAALRAAPSADPAGTIVIVAVSRAEGLAGVLASLGAHVVRPGHGWRPSVGELSAAIEATGSPRAIVLPNDRDAFLAARQAAELVRPIEVAIVPTRNAAEGIAAAVAYDPDATFEESVARMTADAQALRSFAVIRAARDALVDGTPVARGRFLALDADRHLLAHGDGLEEVVATALKQLGTVELVTCYHGEHLAAPEARRLSEAIARSMPEAEVELVPGGQRHDLLLVAVE